MIATVTSKGQVTLPVEARRRLGIGIWVNDGGYRLPLPGPGNDGSLKAQPV